MSFNMFRSKRLTSLVAGLMVTSLLCGFVGALPNSLETLPLLDATSMRYLGSFTIPQEDGNGVSLTYGGNALSYDPANRGLFIGCHDYTQYLAEVRVPNLTNPPQTATFLQNCADVTEGRLPLVDDYLPRLGGSLLYNDRLIVSAYGDYDADFSQTASHFVSTPDLDLAGDIAGPFMVGTGLPASVSGYMGLVPPEWETTFGGPALTGQCCVNIISRTSYGPSVSVFDPDDVGVANPIPATSVLFYPAEHPLDDPEAQSALFNLTTRMGGVAFPSGTRSVLFLGRHGTGPYCYDTGEICGDPVDPYKGPHAYPYVFQVWAYDALDLAAVKNGEKASWEVQPYATWQLTEIGSAGDAFISGAFYDSASRRLYVTEQYEDAPQVHVYQIAAATAFASASAQDGWILESGESANAGSALNVTSTLRLGDSAAKRQYRAILSFATGAGLPDNAVIAKVTLRVRRQGVVGGGNPVTNFQGFMVDIRKGTFGASALEAADFQATANRAYGPFSPALASGWYSFNLTSAKAYVNKLATGNGLTQIRLRFKLGDDNNATANYLSLYSGNAGAASRPQLIVEYYVP